MRGRGGRERGRGGVEIEEDRPGDGPIAERGATVVVRYSSYLRRGEAFERDRVLTLTLGQRRVIAGLEYAIEGMRVAGRRRIRVGPHLAYRARGVPGRIPPNAVLTFDLELLEVLRVVGGIDAGGTKWLCAVGTSPGNLLAQSLVPTGPPADTLARVAAFFAEQRDPPVTALGIACFGPIDLDPASPTFGFITTTPKPGWANVDVVGAFRSLGVPVSFDTDVNGAALGEARWGAGREADPLVYVTVGTGIGGGAIVNGRLLHGLGHPEMGHVPLRRDPLRDPFPGACPYHRDCLDGLASGRALRERWGAAAETLPPDHPAWDLETEYLALGLAAIISILSPRRIVVGGGVMRQPTLLERVRARLDAVLAGYVRAPQIVAPALGAHSGVFGAFALAQGASPRRRDAAVC